jgi:dTDP-4-dehydrorhamnose 3,5-epimerase
MTSIARDFPASTAPAAGALAPSRRFRGEIGGSAASARRQRGRRPGRPHYVILRMHIGEFGRQIVDFREQHAGISFARERTMTALPTGPGAIEKIETGLPGVFLLQPSVYRDARGAFFESYHRAKLAALGIREPFVQDNESLSVRGTLRGLHYQRRQPQAKLCRVAQGEVLDVAVDLRRGSPQFGKWVSAILSGENRRQIYIPAGFAHGFLVLSETAQFLYKCSRFYQADDDRGIRWNDPQLAIGWNIASPLLSAKDAALPLLADVPPDQLPGAET